MRLPDVLYYVIPAFIYAAHNSCKELPHVKSFHTRFQFYLSLLKFDLDAVIANQIISEDELVLFNEIGDLLEPLVDAEALSHPGFEEADHGYTRLSVLRDVPKPEAYIRFSEAIEDREYLLRRLQRCSHSLKEMIKRKNFVLEDAVEEYTNGELPREILQQANNLYRIVSRHWQCDCITSCRLINLSLTDIHEPLIVGGWSKFDVLVSASEKGLKWQEGEVLIRPASRKIKFMGCQSTHEPRRMSDAVLRCDNSALQSSSTICRLIKRAFKASARLSLEVDGDILKVENKLHPKQLHVMPGRGLPLSPAPPSLTGHIRTMTTRELNALMLTLARTLLQLYDEDPEGPMYWVSSDWRMRNGHWATPQWTKNITFYSHGRVKPSKIDFRRPYLSTMMNTPPLTLEAPFNNIEDALHHAPSILALGKVLLELQLLYLGLPITPEFPDVDDSDIEEDEERNVNFEYTQTASLLDQYGNHLPTWCFRAIDACLNHLPIQEMSIREYIFKKIVRPLEHNLHFNSPSPEQVQVQLEQLKRTTQPAKVMKAKNQLHVPLHVPFCLYGDDDDILLSNEDIKKSSQWFEWLDSVHARIRHEGVTGERVKIAVLDTGVELSEDQRDIYDRNGEMQYKSWIDGEGEGFENSRDDVGHGTHTATLVAQVARHAVLHVARVFKSRRPSLRDEVKNVAQAIRYAVDIWKVDIIVMSFGFDEEQDSPTEISSISKAIKHATNKGICIFAAACNDGRNRPSHVSWPARALDVICVHSATGTGQSSWFTPGPHDNQRIMVLGECVQSAWPPRLGAPKNKRYKSGTSCATPIAAGVAAILLQYARRSLSNEQWKRLRTVDCMQRMFERMKDDRIEKEQGYWYIRPWDFFDKDNSREWIENEIRKAIK